MSKIVGGLLGSSTPKFATPATITPPAPAVDVAAAPITEVDAGAGATTEEMLRRRYRPVKSGIGTTGTGLSL